jgi:hypothetical protein
MALTYRLIKRYNLPRPFTQAALQELEAALGKLESLMKAVVQPHMPSQLRTIKFHKQCHLPEDITALGHPNEFSSADFENDHTNIKRRHRNSSKKRSNDQITTEIVKRQRISAALAELPLPAPAGSGSSGKQKRVNATAWMRASEAGTHQLQSRPRKLSLHAMAHSGAAPPPLTTAVARVRDSALLLRSNRLLADLPLRLREHLHDRQHGEAAERAAAATGRRQRADSIQLPELELDRDTILHSTFGVLAADCSWEPEHTVLLTVRATARHCHRAKYDVVKVRRATGRYQGRQSEEFAQLQLLFLFEGQQLAYVRWYEASPGRSQDVLAEYGCQRVRFKTVKDPRTKKQIPDCTVIPLASIISREYCCRDHSDEAGGAYHISSCVRLQG